MTPRLADMASGSPHTVGELPALRFESASEVDALMRRHRQAGALQFIPRQIFATCDLRGMRRIMWQPQRSGDTTGQLYGTVVSTQHGGEWLLSRSGEYRP